MKIDAVIFDLDGTLYDNRGLPLKMVLSDPRHILLMASERRCRKRMLEATYESFFAAVAKDCGYSAESVASWFTGTYMPGMVNVLRQGFRAYGWVAPTVKTLREKNIRTAVFSDYGFVDEKLRAVGLDPGLFDVRTGALDCGGFKPYAPAFLKVASMLGAEPGNVLVAGDRDDNDGAGARAAGMHYLWIDRKNPENTDICSVL